MLANFDEVKRILICPRTGKSLVQDGDSFVSLSDGEPSEIRYITVGQSPALIDFDESVLSEKDMLIRDGVSVIQRRQSRLRSWIKGHLLHPDANRLAASTASDFAEKLKRKAEKPKLLIIGAGEKGIGTDVFYDDPDIQVIGFDIYASPLTHFIADAHRIPLESGSVDGVWVQYVLEHVLDPWMVVSEISRVLSTDGLIYSETPFMQQVHEGPYDFVRFTHSGHRWLFREFHEIKSGVAMGAGVQLLWTLEHNVRGVFRSRTLGQAVKLACSFFRLIEKIIPSRYVIDSASSFYFYGEKSHQPLKPKDMISYYQGATGG